MPGSIASCNERTLKDDLRELVRITVQDTLNGLLEEEAEILSASSTTSVTANREACRAGRYDRKPTTTIIERYRRRETNVEEAMIEMHPAGVSPGG